MRCRAGVETPRPRGRHSPPGPAPRPSRAHRRHSRRPPAVPHRAGCRRAPSRWPAELAARATSCATTARTEAEVVAGVEVGRGDSVEPREILQRKVGATAPAVLGDVLAVLEHLQRRTHVVGPARPGPPGSRRGSPARSARPDRPTASSSAAGRPRSGTTVCTWSSRLAATRSRNGSIDRPCARIVGTSRTSTGARGVPGRPDPAQIGLEVRQQRQPVALGARRRGRRSCGPRRRPRAGHAEARPAAGERRPGSSRRTRRSPRGQRRRLARCRRAEITRPDGAS